jgi:hypothetical protein
MRRLFISSMTAPIRDFRDLEIEASESSGGGTKVPGSSHAYEEMRITINRGE